MTAAACGNECADVAPYGFVPESGCPEHDPKPGHTPVVLGRSPLCCVLCSCGWRSPKARESSAWAAYEEHMKAGGAP